MSALAAIVAFSIFAQTGARAASQIETIVFARGGCFGNCPVYTVRLHRDGTVEYTGYDFVNDVGPFRGTLSQTRFDTLARDMEAASTLTPRPPDKFVIVDGPTVRLTALRRDGTTVGADRFPHDAMTALESAIDGAIATTTLEPVAPEIETLDGTYRYFGTDHAYEATLRYRDATGFRLLLDSFDRDPCNGYLNNTGVQFIDLSAESGRIHGTGNATISRSGNVLHIDRPSGTIDLPVARNAKPDLYREPSSACKVTFRLVPSEQLGTSFAIDGDGKETLKGIGPEPVLTLTTWSKIDETDFLQHVHFHAEGSSAPAFGCEMVGSTFDRKSGRAYNIRPAVALQQGVTYAFSIDAGIRPIGAGTASDAFQEFVEP